MTNELIARNLVRMIIDVDELDELELKMGGEGDTGESLIVLLTNLLDTGRITITFNDTQSIQ